MRLEVEAGHGGVAHAEGVKIIVVVLGLKCRALEDHGSVVVVVLLAVKRSVEGVEGGGVGRAVRVRTYGWFPFSLAAKSPTQPAPQTHHGPTRPVPTLHHTQRGLAASSALSRPVMI